MPNTEKEIGTVLAAMPDEIDGRQAVPRTPLLRTYGHSSSVWHIWVEDIQPRGEAVLTATELLVLEASYLSAEASAVDPSGDLMWVAIYEATEEPAAYLLMWSKPDSSWVFFAMADSETGRVALVDAFVTAAGG